MRGFKNLKGSDARCFYSFLILCLKCGKVPSCARANQMTFPTKPDVLENLTPLEERLISPRIPFMQVRELPRRSIEH